LHSGINDFLHDGGDIHANAVTFNERDDRIVWNGLAGDDFLTLCGDFDKRRAHAGSNGFPKVFLKVFLKNA
jgi:hypothetical protein